MDINIGRSGTSDPYCTVNLGMERRETTVIKRELNPIWNKTFQPIAVVELTADVLVTVYDKDLLSQDDPIGRVLLPLYLMEPDVETEGWYELFPLQESTPLSTKFYPNMSSKDDMRAPGGSLGFIKLKHSLTLVKPLPKGPMAHAFRPKQLLAPLRLTAGSTAAKFGIDRLKFNLIRVKQAIAPIQGALKKWDRLKSWENPGESFLAIVFLFYACTIAQLWHVPCIITAGLQYLGATRGANIFGQLPHWKKGHGEVGQPADADDGEGGSDDHADDADYATAGSPVKKKKVQCRYTKQDTQSQ
jgi:hypothetical protein